MGEINMEQWGLTSSFAAEAARYSGLCIGRILSQYNGLYLVISENGELLAETSGKYRFSAKSPIDFPAVGDFVMLDRNTNKNGNAIIHYTLSRKSAFIRKASGTSNCGQVVASNIDTVFICMSLNHDFNLRRLERYLSIGWDSGAIPVVILTKSDLCTDLKQRILEVESVAIGASVLVTSAVLGDSYAQLLQYIASNHTAAFIGSSGVGKSTLINRLAEENRQHTNGLRNDDKGKHTTTRRELILMENGGMVIDTPGMRELGLESADLSRTFSDISGLASLCRFCDCTHTKEPGCAVRQAVSEGTLSEERLESYRKLKKEAIYDGLDSRQIEALKMQEMFRDFGGIKNARKYMKGKNSRRH